MSKVYNNQKKIAKDLNKFFIEICGIKLTKPQQKIIPYIIIGMLDAESATTLDISKKLKGDFSFIQLDSVQRKIRRFLNNNNFDIYSFYEEFIKYIISKYKTKHSDNRVHIAIDHSFCNDDFTCYTMSLRLGKQGIPIWFRCFKGVDDANAFSFNLLKQGIDFVTSIFKDTDYKIIFLGDRWFYSNILANYIDSLNCTYVIRLKRNIHALFPIAYSKFKEWKALEVITHRKFVFKIYKDIPLTYERTVTNIIFGRNDVNDDPWILATNGDPNRAIKDYSYRFGAIEFIFKNQNLMAFI